MPTSNVLYFANTQVEKIPSHIDRVNCTLETLHAAQRKKIRLIVVDGWSTCTSFRRSLEYYDRSAENITVKFLDDCDSYMQQIQESYRYCLENSHWHDELIIRFEPEKTDFLSEENIQQTIQSISEARDAGGFEFISFTRKIAKNIPDSHRISEDWLAKNLHNLFAQRGINLDHFHDWSPELKEFPWIFWPLIATKKGAERILNMRQLTDRAGNEILIWAIVESLLDKYFQRWDWVMSYPLDFRYDHTYEYLPEQEEWERLQQIWDSRPKLSFYWETPDVSSFDSYKSENPWSLVLKREETYIYLYQAVLRILNEYPNLH